jgi:hypothetical protein
MALKPSKRFRKKLKQLEEESLEDNRTLNKDYNTVGTIFVNSDSKTNDSVDDLGYYYNDPIVGEEKAETLTNDYAKEELDIDSYTENVLKAKLDCILNKDYSKPCDCKTIADCDNRCKGNADDVLKEIVKLRDSVSDPAKGYYEPEGYGNKVADVEYDDEVWELQKKKKEMESLKNPYDYIKSSISKEMKTPPLTKSRLWGFLDPEPNQPSKI